MDSVAIHKYFLRRNIRFQTPVLKNLIWLETSISLQKPEWTTEFIKNYITCHYGDIVQYYTQLRDQYYHMTESHRNIYRVRLVTTSHLCVDVIQHIECFL
jgi:hypothetical protein